MNRRKIFELTKGRCFYCGCELELENFHVDHFIPKASGGKDSKNAVPACPECNLAKSNLTVGQFRDKLETLLDYTHHGRLIDKYYAPARVPIQFYFERCKDGTIQND